MASATWTLSSPIAQANITGFLVGSPIEIDVQNMRIVVTSQQTTAGAPVGTATTNSVTITQAELQSLLATIMGLFITHGTPIPAGTMVII
jgi:hypothetical protein